MLINNQGNYLNKSETDVELEILFIASPIRPEIGKTSIFLTFLVFSTLSIVVEGDQVFPGQNRVRQ